MKPVPMILAGSLTGLLFPATAAPVADGLRSEGEYGPPVAVQTVNTQFGDATDTSGGSELNAAYATIEGGFLHLLITGNLERNYNKLEIFIDSEPGGENTITTDNPGNDFEWASKMAGLTFDEGFAADYLLFARVDNDNFFLDFSEVGKGAGAFGELIIQQPTTPGNFGPWTAPNGVIAGWDNSNLAGVVGGTDAADPAAAEAVDTGLELSIPLSLIGNPKGEIRVCIFINGSGHDFVSNQFLPGLPPGTGNLGGDGSGTLTNVDLSAIEGQQFFTLQVPDLRILSIVPSGTTGGGLPEFTLTWTSRQGFLYTIEESSELNGIGGWTDVLQEPVTATGSESSAEVSTLFEPDSRAFWRVREIGQAP